MSFPHFGHSYGSASQVRETSMGDGGRLGGGSTQCTLLPLSALLSLESLAKPERAGPGLCTTEPCDIPNPWLGTFHPPSAN